MRKRVRIDRDALQASVQQTLQAAFDENALGLKEKGQALLDAVFDSHAGQAPDTIEAELHRRYLTEFGTEANHGSFRPAAEAIAQGRRASFAVHVVVDPRTA